VAKRLGRQEDKVETTPLWHGTDVDTVSKITIGKFDRGYIGKNGILCTFYEVLELFECSLNLTFIGLGYLG